MARSANDGALEEAIRLVDHRADSLGEQSDKHTGDCESPIDAWKKVDAYRHEDSANSQPDSQRISDWNAVNVRPAGPVLHTKAGMLQVKPNSRSAGWIVRDRCQESHLSHLASVKHGQHEVAAVNIFLHLYLRKLSAHGDVHLLLELGGPFNDEPGA